MIEKCLGYLRGAVFARALVRLDRGLELSLVNGQVKFGARAHLWPGVKISVRGRPGMPGVVRIGRRASLGDRIQVHACFGVEVGEGTLISWEVCFLENVYHHWTPERGVFSDSSKPASRGPIKIGRNCWIGKGATVFSDVVIGDRVRIGAGAVIFPRVRIGDGADIRPGAVVQTDVPAGAIATPAAATLSFRRPEAI